MTNNVASQKIRNKDNRLLVLKALGGRCIKCGAIENLLVHHNNYETDENKLSNMVLICHDCHEEATRHIVINSEVSDEQ
jgi:hypothetical protein